MGAGGSQRADMLEGERMANATPRRIIRIKAGPLEVEAELNHTGTAAAVWDALPISARGSTWGDEIYFGIQVQRDLEDGQEVVDLGDLGYWPPGKAFCIFFGPTPASRGQEIRPASAVTVVGRVASDPKVFKAVRSGAEVTITRAEPAGHQPTA